MNKLLYIIFALILVSCGGGSDSHDHDGEDNDSTEVNHQGDNGEDIEVESDYDMGTVDVEDRQEFKENLANIEKEHGEQWDFCTCVVKNDSINKAVQEAKDSEIDRLFERLEVIDQHCKAFLVQSKNATPEERQAHEKKVKKCLQEAGVK